MSIAPQNEAPTWRGITDVQSVVSGLMAADRGAELGIAVPSSDSDSQSPADDAQGVESDDPAANDDSDSEVSLSADDTTSALPVEAQESDQSPEEDGTGADIASDVELGEIDVESASDGQADEQAESVSVDADGVNEASDIQGSAGDGDAETDGPEDSPGETDAVDAGPEVPMEADDIQEAGEIVATADGADDIQEAGEADIGADDAGEMNLPEVSAGDDIAPVDDPEGAADQLPDAPDVSSGDDDSPEGVMSGIEFESSISPVPFEWSPEDNSPEGWNTTAEVPDQLSLPISDIGGTVLTDRTQGY